MLFLGFTSRALIAAIVATLFWSGLSLPVVSPIFAGSAPETLLSWGSNYFSATWIAVALLAFAWHGLGILRWRILLEAQGFSPPLGTLVRHWCAGSMFAPFFHGGLGRTVYRIYAGARTTGSPSASVGAIVIEWTAGLAAFTCSTLFALIFIRNAIMVTYPDTRQAELLFSLQGALILAVLIGVAVLSIAIVMQQRLLRVSIGIAPLPSSLRRHFYAVAGAITVCAQRPGAFAWVFLVSLGMQAILWAAGYLFLLPWLMSTGSNAALLAESLFMRHPWLGYLYTTPLPETLPLAEGLVVPKAMLTPQLGWLWEGLILLIGVPLFVFIPNPRAVDTAKPLTSLDPLTPTECHKYRAQLIAFGVAGLFAGLIGGALAGLAEAWWTFSRLLSDDEAFVMLWGPIAYGLLFMPIGLLLAKALSIGYLIVNIQRTAMQSFGLVLSLCAFLAVLVFGRWRYIRDIRFEQPMTLWDNVGILLIAIAICLVIERTISLLLGRRTGSILKGAAVGCSAFACIAGVGCVLSRVLVEDIPMAQHRAKEGSEAPNIVLIVADTLRADYLPMYDDRIPARTPHLAKLAAEGTLFRNSLAMSGWTKPSFATMWSGLKPTEHLAAVQGSHLAEGIETFAELLVETGYYTAGFPNNHHIHKNYGFHRGFVEYTNLECDSFLWASLSVREMALYQVLRRFIIHSAGGKGVPTGHFYRPADFVAELAEDWLGSQSLDKSPFLLFLHLMDNHAPYLPEGATHSPYARWLQGTYPDPEKFLNSFVDAYHAETERVDAAVGRIVGRLQDLGLYENTMIVFTSDHGEEFFEHGGWWHGATLYDEVSRVPLIIKFPDGAAAGMEVVEVAHHFDIKPTLLAAANLDAKSHAGHGNAWTPERVAATGTGRTLYQENTFQGNVLQRMRSNAGSLIHNVRNGRLPVEYEFYKLSEDPGEKSNLAGHGLPEEKHYRELLESQGGYFDPQEVE